MQIHHRFGPYRHPASRDIETSTGAEGRHSASNSQRKNPIELVSHPQHLVRKPRPTQQSQDATATMESSLSSLTITQSSERPTEATDRLNGQIKSSNPAIRWMRAIRITPRGQRKHDEPSRKIRPKTSTVAMSCAPFPVRNDYETIEDKSRIRRMTALHPGGGVLSSPEFTPPKQGRRVDNSSSSDNNALSSPEGGSPMMMDGVLDGN
jgi:hypothetical protein